MQTKDALRALSALSQETRLAVYSFLVERVPEGAYANAIAKHLRLASPALSFHLKEMTHAGLVTASPEGRFVRFQADLDVVQEVIGYLEKHCVVSPRRGRLRSTSGVRSRRVAKKQVGTPRR